MKGTNPDTRHAHASIVNRAIDSLDGRLGTDLTLESIASELDVSPDRLHRMFAEVTGESLQQHIGRSRIQMAAHHLLYASSLSISAIASQCGYSSPSEFARDFKQATGEEPERFREQGGGMASRVGGMDDKDWAQRISVREFPAKEMFYLRHFGQRHYAYPGADVNQSFITLSQMATRTALWASGANLVGIPRYSLMNVPSLQVGYDVGVTSRRKVQAAGDVGSRTLQGGKYAVLHLEEPREAIEPCIQLLLTSWLPASGYSYAWRPTVFMIHNNPLADPQGKWVVDVCLPID